MRDDSITFIDRPPPGNAKYPQLLAAIKVKQLADSGTRDKWAVLNTFSNEGSARDLAYRLTRKYPDFEVVAVRDSDSDHTDVLARLRDGVEE